MKAGLTAALMSPSWSSADASDDPLEAAKDSVFVRILLKLIQEGEKRWEEPEGVASPRV